MRKLTLALAAAGVAALTIGTLHAQQGGAPQLPGQADVSRVEAGSYTVDAAHSMVGWKLNHFGFNVRDIRSSIAAWRRSSYRAGA